MIGDGSEPQGSIEKPAAAGRSINHDRPHGRTHPRCIHDSANGIGDQDGSQTFSLECTIKRQLSDERSRHRIRYPAADATGCLISGQGMRADGVEGADTLIGRHPDEGLCHPRRGSRH